MQAGDWAFVGLAANPVGGLLLAVPFAVLKLHYPTWLIVAEGAPLAYLQAAAVDLLWDGLNETAWWKRLLERSRNRHVERLMESRGGFWITFFATPLLGPWVVMAFIRYVRESQRRVILPMLLALAAFTAILSTACSWLPALFAR